MIPYLTPLVTFDLKTKIEKQVRFFVDLPNAFFKLVRQLIFQNGFCGRNFNFSKTFEISSAGVGWSKTIAFDPVVLEDHSGPTKMDQKRFGRKTFFDFLHFFQAFLKHMKRSKNEISSKVSFVSQIRIAEIGIWYYTLLLLSRVILKPKLKNKLDFS